MIGTTNASGKSATLTTKSITANGTYNASSDNADGYSSVEVEVPDTLVQFLEAQQDYQFVFRAQTGAAGTVIVETWKQYRYLIYLPA